MFKPGFALALALCSASIARAGEFDRDHGAASAADRPAAMIPQQAAGPVKIRFRKIDEAALRLAIAIPGHDGSGAHRAATAEASID